MIKTFDYDNEPVVNIVNEMILDAINRGASDIHFDPTPTTLKVRIRIDGELIDYAEVPEVLKKNLTTRIKIISGMNITETRLPQDGAIKTDIDNKNVDLRVSSLPISDGEKIVIRILDYTMSLSGLENLGFSKENLERVNKMISVPNGIILTTGATGSGKSTTVYAMLQKLNTAERNIITVEDPVEMKIKGINQVQVLSDIGLTFGNALRSILRQDPDIIMIGEIRDDETARIAVRASITGHLVLSTIHTNNSLNTIERLLDMDIERYLLGSALTGILSQRLTKKLCPKCRRLRATTPYEKNVFKVILNQDVAEIYEPVGCDECINGYHGRIAIHEVLLLNQEIRDAIVNNISRDKLRKLVYDDCGTITLLQDGLAKVISGETSFSEIVRVIDIDNDLDESEEHIKNALLGKGIELLDENTDINQAIPVTEPIDPVIEPTNEETAPIINDTPIDFNPTPEVINPVIEPVINEIPNDFNNPISEPVINEVTTENIIEPTPVIETPIMNEPMPEATPILGTEPVIDLNQPVINNNPFQNDFLNQQVDLNIDNQ